jgi:multidrug efflux system outer membrane protein
MNKLLNTRATPALRLSAMTVLLLAFTGQAFAAPAADGGVAGLQQLLTGKLVGLGDTSTPVARPGEDPSATINALLKAPLGAEAAVRIALLNNPGLQVSLASAGVGLTDTVGATSPARRKAQQTLTRLSTDARKAWIEAVSAAQSAGYMREAKEATEAAGELARRMTQVGNISKFQQAREQAALSDDAVQLAKAQQAAFNAREKLIVMLGLWGEQTGFELPGELPPLPPQPQNLPDIETRVVKESEAIRLANTQWQLKLAGPRPASADGLWDAMGDAAKVRELAVKTRSEARQAYNNYRTAYDLARHYRDEVMPLRKFINDEVVLRYNGMLLSVFDLLADARTQVMAARSAVEAKRDFWLADAELQTMLAGAPAVLSSGAPASGNAAADGAAAH